MTPTQPGCDAIVARLREALEKPLGEQWSHDEAGDSYVWHADGDAVCRCFYNMGDSDIIEEADVAAYIAAMSPDAIRALLAHMDGLKKDKDRLEWLERQDLNDVVVIRRTNDVVGIDVGYGPAYGKTLRAAIDAAMAEGADRV